MEYWNIFLAFFRIGIFGYGGGPSMIPLFHTECVKRYKWVTADEFADYLALGNALPGPIATKMASYVGYKVKGWAGSIIAISAVTLPVLITMIGLLQFVYALKESGLVHGMVQAIQPVIGIMMAALAYEFAVKGWKDAGNKQGFVGMMLISVVLIHLLDVHPGILVALSLVGSFLYSTWQTRKHEKKSLDVGA
ncbi:chromate transporter [Brevibacillus sp. H7]|uniref:chromate transporter n=1 Tax=Brevibacillus sp. H7 TaxID=3349138 RepID=UPI0038289426